jgi:hypothetical protein
MSKKIKLGSTGEFPRGKLSVDDEGGLQIAVYEKDKTVIVNFGKSVDWIGLDRDTARQLGQSLIEKANSI